MTKKGASAIVAKLTRNKPLSEKSQQRLAELERLDSEKAETKSRWLKELIATARGVNAARKAYRAEIYKALQSVYRLYLEIEFSGELRNDFYAELKQKLIDLDYNIQKNTRDAALLVRLVFGKEFSNSKVHQYVSVLQYAQDNDVTVEDFVNWLEKETITGAVKAAANTGVDPEVIKQRYQRARLLLLRYLEWRETRPFATQKMLAWSAQRYLGQGTDLCVMIGTAIRRYDRESDYADIYISHILPPNLEFDIKIIDRWAKFIAPKLEIIEADFEEKTEDEWGDDLHTLIWDYDVRQAEKVAQYWQLRQQAALAQDQHEFVKTAKRQLKTKLKK
jgi:hypothetical protein